MRRKKMGVDESFKTSAMTTGERFADLVDSMANAGSARVRVKLVDGRVVTVIAGIGATADEADHQTAICAAQSDIGRWNVKH
jgi:hypothetical protein